LRNSCNRGADLRGAETEVVVAVKDLSIERGSAGSHAFACDDGRTYFVKFNDGTRTVVNEHIGYSLAGFLGLPVPESRLVTVPKELIDASQALRGRGIATGVHHGTVWLEGFSDFRGVLVREMTMKNAEVLPGLIVLDNLLLNIDRNNPGNNLIHKTETGLEFRSVDFSEILSGRNWTVETLGASKNVSYLMPVFTVLALSVKELSSFSPWLEMVEGLSSEKVGQILTEVPSSWRITEEEKSAVSDFILTRKTMVRGILATHKARFLNWR